MTLWGDHRRALADPRQEWGRGAALLRLPPLPLLHFFSKGSAMRTRVKIITPPQDDPSPTPRAAAGQIRSVVRIYHPSVQQTGSRLRSRVELIQPPPGIPPTMRAHPLTGEVGTSAVEVLEQLKAARAGLVQQRAEALERIQRIDEAIADYEGRNVDGETVEQESSSTNNDGTTT